MPEIQQLHSDDLWLWGLHRAENYSSKGNLSLSPLKTLDSHICCLLDPEPSIFLSDRNVFFFLLWKVLTLPGGEAWKVAAYRTPVARLEISTVSHTEELCKTENYRVAFQLPSSKFYLLV